MWPLNYILLLQELIQKYINIKHSLNSIPKWLSTVDIIVLVCRLFTPDNYAQMRHEDRTNRNKVWSHGVDMPCRVDDQNLEAQGKSYFILILGPKQF